MTEGRLVYRVEQRKTREGPYRLRDRDDLPVLSGFDMPLPWKDSLLVRQLPTGVPHYRLGLLSVCLSARDLHDWFREARGAETLVAWDMAARAYWVPAGGQLFVGRGQGLVDPTALRRPAIAGVGFEEFYRFGPHTIEQAVAKIMVNGLPPEPKVSQVAKRLTALTARVIRRSNKSRGT